MNTTKVLFRFFCKIAINSEQKRKKTFLFCTRINIFCLKMIDSHRPRRHVLHGTVLNEEISLTKMGEIPCF